MMRILILEDAIFKREQITDFLETKNIEYVTYEYVLPALKDITKNKDFISGIILDLGLQSSIDAPETYSLQKGLDVIRELSRKKINIPVLVNSSTEVRVLNRYPCVYGQRKQIDDYQILEDFINFLKDKKKQ